MSITSIVTQVVPYHNIQPVTFNYTENTGYWDTQRQNFGVNGERLTDLIGGLEQLDGQLLGRAFFGGDALVEVTAVPRDATLPTWVDGTVTITALGTGIEYFAIGASSQLLIDDICLNP